MLEKTLEYIDSHEQDYTNTLKEAVAIESISANPDYAESVLKMKEFLREKLEKLNFQNIQESNYGGYPVLYGERMVDPTKPTLLIYGHYDVQPVEPLELWDNPPFQMKEENGILYGRGTVDDKGPTLTHLFALEAMDATGIKQEVNIKVIFEGEEESGGKEIGKFIVDHKDLLACDYVIVSDTYMVKENTPAITNALRGICYFEIELAAAKSDVHSGVLGGAVPNPANILMKMLASAKDDFNKIQIPGFYDDVLEIDQETKKMFDDLEFDDEEFKKEFKLPNIDGEHGYTTLERRWTRPTFDVHGMGGGFSGVGAKTIIPNKVHAKFSCRLVPAQKAQDVVKKVKDYFEEICPDCVTMNINTLHAGDPWYIDFNSPSFDIPKQAIEKAFGKKAIALREGGSIPVIEEFSQNLGAPCILFALGNPNNNAHAPNEWYRKDYFMKAIKTNVWFYHLLAGKSDKS